MSQTLRKLFSDARRAQPVREHTAPGFDMPTRIVPKSMIEVAFLRLDDPLPNIAAYFDSEGKLLRTPAGYRSVTDATVDPLKIVAAHSRLARAGAHLLLRDPPAAPIRVGLTDPLPVLRREVSGFSVVQPMKLAVVADGANVTAASELPILTAKANWSDEDAAPIYGARIEVARADYRDRLHDGSLEEGLTAAIIAGIGRIADQALFAALDEASLGAFSLAAAAAAGIEFGSLRSVVGTTAAGASVNADGHLRVSGVPAELVDVGSATFVGAFDNAAVLLDREVRIIAERTNLDGTLAVTVFGSAVALVPDVGKFWKVSA